MQYETGSAAGESYRLGRRLKSGSTGDIFETTHPLLQGSCAIKILRPRLLASAEQLQAFRTDLETVAALRHPNIVQIIEVGTLPNGPPFVVMEMLEGRLVAERLAGHRTMPIQDVVDVVKAIAAALQAAHSRGVIHGEISPGNVFLARAEGYDAGVVKLLNFGIHRLRPVDAAASLAVDLIRYLAPEQATGHTDDVDGRADQFALALMAHRMLSGIEAFRGLSAIDVLHEIIHEEPQIERPPEVTAEVESVLRRALARDKRYRFETVVAFSRALESALTGETSGAQIRVTPPPRVPPPRVEEPARIEHPVRMAPLRSPPIASPHAAATTILGFAASEEARPPRAVITHMGPPRPVAARPAEIPQRPAPRTAEMPIVPATLHPVTPPIVRSPVASRGQFPVVPSKGSRPARPPIARAPRSAQQPPRSSASTMRSPVRADSLLTEPFFDAFPSGRFRADTVDLEEELGPRPRRQGWRLFFFLIAVAAISLGASLAVGWRPPLEWRQSDIWRGLGLPGAADPPAAVSD